MDTIQLGRVKYMLKDSYVLSLYLFKPVRTKTH